MLQPAFHEDVKPRLADQRAAEQPPPLPMSVFRSSWASIDGAGRWLAAGLACSGVFVFVLGAALRPYADDGAPLSHGTHRQLGLPPCHLQSLFGVPCPSCGMTTSISLCMRGDFAAAVKVNWAGVVVAVLGVLAIGWLSFVALAGRCPRRLKPERAVQWLVIAGATAAVVRYLAVVTAWVGG
jgi:uncharacterized RDD family membrane protein YckC